MNTLYKNTNIEVKEYKEKTFVAYASTFGNTDCYNDIMVEGCYKNAIKKAEDTGRYPKLLYGHRSSNVCGIIKDMEEDSHGLLIAGEFIDTTKGRDTYTEVKAGAIDSMSVGFYLKGYEIEGDKRYIKDLDLFEVSFVAFPANEQALVQDIKENKWSWDDESLVKHLEQKGWDCKKREDTELLKMFDSLERLMGDIKQCQK